MRRNPYRREEKNMAVKIAIASDHAGVDYKKRLIEHLTERGYECVNLGTNTEDSVDYPVYAGRVCDSTCRGHDGRCRNRIITQECNLVKFNEDEAASEQFSRLCGTPAPCPQLRCHVPATDSAAVSGGCRSHTRNGRPAGYRE